jgi:hypothetical protein
MTTITPKHIMSRFLSETYTDPGKHQEAIELRNYFADLIAYGDPNNEKNTPLWTTRRSRLIQLSQEWYDK